jgi:hypothetical protein
MVEFPSAYVVVETMYGQMAGDTFQLVVYMSPLHLAWHQSHEVGTQLVHLAFSLKQWCRSTVEAPSNYWQNWSHLSQNTAFCHKNSMQSEGTHNTYYVVHVGAPVIHRPKPPLPMWPGLLGPYLHHWPIARLRSLTFILGAM